MNYAQIILFLVFVFSVLACGLFARCLCDREDRHFINRSLYFGEALLLGSIIAVGELLLLSLFGLYSRNFIWGAMFLNYAFLLDRRVRNKFEYLLPGRRIFNLPNIIFIILLLVFVFRNLFFMVDVDSHSVYLFTQRLWLEHGSSIFGNSGYDIRIFVPQFDAVPYGLGISVFGKETLFAELINIFWRLIVLLLVYGYTSCRFNKYCALAAVMLVLFNDHFFISGANHSVIINAALIAFLFGAAYNFWEARSERSGFRFFLGLIFLSQLMANKYQMAYVLFFMFILGLSIQHKPVKIMKEVFSNKSFFLCLLASVLILSLWYVKNFLATGDPFLPFLAGRLNIFNWSKEQEYVCMKVFASGMKPLTFVKYMNYFFIWPGINSAKFIILTIAFLPLILITANQRKKVTEEASLELFFWLSSGILVIMGTALVCFHDPRYYRFPLAILSFAAVFSLRYIMEYCLNLKKEVFLTGIILFIALVGVKSIYRPICAFPTVKENIGVLFDKIHMDYCIRKYFPHVLVIDQGLKDNAQKLDKAAWGLGEGQNYPQFLIPTRPLVSLWSSSLIKWNSYGNTDAIISDLTDAGIEWVMVVEDKQLRFLPIQEYALIANKFNRFPDKTYCDYGFPPELNRISY